MWRYQRKLRVVVMRAMHKNQRPRVAILDGPAAVQHIRTSQAHLSVRCPPAMMNPRKR